LPVPIKGSVTGLPSHDSESFKRGARYCLVAANLSDCDELDSNDNWHVPPALPNPGDICRALVLSEVALSFLANPTHVEFSPTGNVFYNAGTTPIILENSSPAWIKLTGETSVSFDTLRFDYRFTSGGTSNGVLSVYFDGSLAFIKEQQFADSRVVSTGPIPLGQIEAGTHSIGFRLDMVGDTPSRVEIDNIRTGIGEIERTVNMPPEAAIRPVASVMFTGSSLVLDGRGSLDLDGMPAPLSYFWSQTGGPSVTINGVSSATASVEISVPGTYSFRLVVSDAQSFSAPAVVEVDVIRYVVDGFLPPVGNAPDINRVRAGQVVPLKWKLSSSSGANISDLGAVQSLGSAPTACATGTQVGEIEDSLVAGGSELRYDWDTNQYVYNWKTSKAWKGMCRALVVMLDDGQSLHGNFEFR